MQMPNFTNIDRETYAQVDKELPDISRLQMMLLIEPNIISINIAPDSNFPIAAACFQDVRTTLSGARYALLESLAHITWYREKANPPNELAAVFFSRFYADDAALRLYSAAEHLAKAIVYILDIGDGKIKDNKSIGRFNKVQDILRKDRPKHPISKAIDALYNSPKWKETMDYRRQWVHHQPPLVKGLGIAYKRERRWKRDETGKILTLGGGGDEAEYSIEDLLGFIRPALDIFIEKLKIIVEFYYSELKKSGVVIEINEDPPP
jgi:hypothetical protein